MNIALEAGENEVDSPESTSGHFWVGKRSLKVDAPARPARLVDVAKLAGVSAMTVSNVLRPPHPDAPPVSTATRERVMEAVQQLGYRPNALARAVRQRRFQHIGYLTRAQGHRLYIMDEVLTGLIEGAGRSGFHVTLVSLPNAPGEGEQHFIPPSLREACVDAMILDNYQGIPLAVRSTLTMARLPLVSMNDDHPVNAVGVDEVAAAKTATHHLIDRGCRKIVFFSRRFPLLEEHHSYKDRRAGYHQAMSEAGLTARELTVEEKAGETEIDELLRSKRRPDAILCYMDDDTLLVYRVARRLGLRVPQDLAYVGFNGGRAAEYAPLPLTTMALPWYQMGLKGCELALSLVNGAAGLQLPSVKLDATLIQGVTT